MKKWMFGLMTLLSCSLFATTCPGAVESLSAKVILKDTTGYFVMSDGTCWKAVGFATRWRSLSEWWNGVELVPDNYACIPDNWQIGAYIEVYPKYGNLDVKESDASNQDQLKECTHLLVNTRNGQILFATALDPAYCLVKVFQDGQHEGYNEGYLQGRKSSFGEASNAYKNGFEDGYKEGYDDARMEIFLP